MQILLAILCDWFLLKIASGYTKKMRLATCLLILSNWFYFSMMNRTYINSIETCLAVISYYFWLIRDRGQKYDILSRIIVGLNFIIRTTSILLWAVIWPYELITIKSNRPRFIFKNLIQMYPYLDIECWCCCLASDSIVFGIKDLPSSNLTSFRY